VKLGKDLREFIELLNSRRVDYIVVGGHAVAFHGHPRFTGDIDFLLRPSQDNVERLIGAVEEFGFSEMSLSPDDFTRPNTVVQLGYPQNRIDLLTSISASPLKKRGTVNYLENSMGSLFTSSAGMPC